MKQLISAALLAAVVAAGPPALAEDAAPAATPDQTAGGEPTPDKKMMQNAFDGAMTCSALAAIHAETLGADERWLWDNRSFAFGMLAVRFWNDATDKQMTGQQLDEALNIYADKINEMAEAKRAVFVESCGKKHADVDKLCEINKCLHAGPPGETGGAASPVPAPPPPPGE